MYNFLKGDAKFKTTEIANIVGCANSINIQFAKEICADKDFPKEKK